MLFHPYPCMCLDSVYAVRRSVSFNLCKFFYIWLHSDGSSCATHYVAFLRDCSFHARVCYLVFSSPSACAKKKCSSSATSEEDVVTSMGVVCKSSLILRRIFSVTFNSNRERKSTAVFTEPAICTVLKLNCST